MQNSRSIKLIVLLLMVVIGLRFYKSYLNKSQSTVPVTTQNELPVKPHSPRVNIDQTERLPNNNGSIDQLTNEEVVIPYLKKNGRLPDCYITKRAARSLGWDPSSGNLCDALPGRAIGGDVFSNREGNLPSKPGRRWYEADLNYDCAHRNADRLLYSDDGLIFVTKDHYKTFTQK